MRRQNRPLVVAHRGASAAFPENTLDAFRGARDLGADWIELDVHLSRDGQLIVIHDETLDRTTSGHGLVRDHTLAELKRLDAGACSVRGIEAFDSWSSRDRRARGMHLLDRGGLASSSRVSNRFPPEGERRQPRLFWRQVRQPLVSDAPLAGRDVRQWRAAAAVYS